MIWLEDVKILNPGQRLRQLRKELQVKQEELAGDKFSKNYISMFENNRRDINAINASYLAQKINEIARQKGKDIQIHASYLLKNEKDIAKDKCEEWLYEVESNLEITNYEANVNLHNTILISTDYNLLHFKGRALFLKGITSFNNNRYICAITQFLDSLIYFAKENDYHAMKDVYKNIGITLLKQKQLGQAIIYFNLCDSVIRLNLNENIDYDNEVTYYKALCYFKLGQYKIAKKIIECSGSNDSKLIELNNEIHRSLAM